MSACSVTTAMVFVDGENFTIRGQQIAKKKLTLDAWASRWQARHMPVTVPKSSPERQIGLP